MCPICDQRISSYSNKTHVCDQQIQQAERERKREEKEVEKHTLHLIDLMEQNTKKEEKKKQEATSSVVQVNI